MDCYCFFFFTQRWLKKPLGIQARIQYFDRLHTHWPNSINQVNVPVNTYFWSPWVFPKHFHVSPYSVFPVLLVKVASFVPHTTAYISSLTFISRKCSYTSTPPPSSLSFGAIKVQLVLSSIYCLFQ